MRIRFPLHARPNASSTAEEDTGTVNDGSDKMDVDSSVVDEDFENRMEDAFGDDDDDEDDIASTDGAVPVDADADKVDDLKEFAVNIIDAIIDKAVDKANDRVRERKSISF